MAESLGSLRVSIGLDSAELTRGLDGINKKLEAVNAEFKSTMAGAGRFDKSLDSLKQKADVLNRTMQVHKTKLSELKRQYEESARTKGKDAAASVRLLTQYNKALAAMRKTEDQLDLVNKRIREQSTGFAQLGAKLNASVNTITTKMRALDAAFKATTAGVDNFGSTSDQLRQKADHLNKSIDLQQQRLKDLRRLYLESKRAKGEDAQETQELSARMNEATAQLREAQAQLRATNTQIEQQANAWHRMGTRAQESGENLRTVGGKLQSIGSEIATSFGVATLAISGALGLATKKSMDFEQQMSNVKSVMDPAEANKYSDALTNLAIKLGADTKYSALEAAQGMEELVKAGVSTKDIMDGGLSGALSLATAGGIGLADAAEIASTALNAFRDDNLSVAKAADILAGAANASATDVQEMKYGLAMTSAVAAGMGLTFKDTSTTLAVFAQNGLKGSDAGTSLKTMLSRLVPMTKASYETMHELGLVTLDTTEAYKRMAEKGFRPASKDLGDIYNALNKYVAKTSGAKEGTDKFSKAFDKATKNLGIMDNKFFDANGNIRSMTEISGELSKALDGMSAKDKQEALYNIFGSDAIRGALILGREGSKGFTAMAKSMDKIKAADVAAERMNNLKGRIEELSGAFETAQINIGTALTPAISALVVVLQKVVDAFNNLSPGMQKFIAISAAVVAALFGIILTFGAVLAGFGAMAAGIGALVEAGGILALSGTVLGSVFAALTSPIALTIAGIMGLVAVFTLVYKHSEQLQKLLGVVFNGIKAGANIAYGGVKVAFDGIIAAVDRVSAYLLEKGPAMWNGFAAGAVNVGTAIQSGFNSAIASIGSFFYSLGQKASQFFGQGVAAKVSEAAGIFFAQLKTAFSSVSGVISIVAPTITAFGLALAGVSGPIGFAITALVSLSGFLFRLYQSNEQFRNSVTTVWAQVSSAISSAMTALQPVFDAFSQYFGEIAAELAPEFAETMNVMVTSLATLKPAFAELGAAIAELGPSFAQLGATFASLAGELGTAFSDAVVQITPLLGELASAFTQMLPGIISLVSGLLNVWVQVQGTLLQVITSIVTSVLPIFVEGFTSLLPIVLNVVQAVFPVILSLIQAIAPVIQMIATTVLPVLLSAVQAIFPVVLTVVKAAMPFVVTIIQLVASVIKDLVVNVLPLILEVVKAVFPLIVPIIQYAAQIIIQVLKAAAIIIKTVLIPAIKFILSIVQAVFPVIVSVIKAALNVVTNVIRLFSALLKGDWKAAWNAVLGILKAIFSPIVKLVTNMGKAISDKWTYVKNKMALLTYEMKKKVMERFNSIVDGAKKLPGRIGDGIKSMAGKAVNGVKSLGNKMIGGFEGIVNGLTQKGINKVLGLVGVDKKHFIPKLEIPRYAKGTSAGGHPGGPAILGDGGGPELFRTPSGFTGLSPGRDTLFNLPKGTQVLPYGMTKKLIAQGIPAFKNGTKKKNLFERGVDAVSGAKDTVVNVAKGAVNKVKDFAFDVWDYVSDPKKLVSKVVSSLGLKLPEISGAFGSMAKGAYEKVKSSMVGFVKKQIDDFGGGFGSGEKATGNVKQWIRKAMAVTKVPSSWFNPLTTIAVKESGGRTGPSTINKWDSNWKRGTPSMGLMQTIRPTFDAYKMKGMGDIMNPVHNAVAAIRYIISRYKTVFNVPGIKSMRAGGPYKGYKIGDIVTQKQLAWVAEEGPEAVIPLKNNRQRALQLYKETGKKLGVESGADQTVVANLLERLVSVEQRSLAALNIIAQKDPSVRVDKDAFTNYVDSSQAQQATMKRLFRGDR